MTCLHYTFFGLFGDKNLHCDEKNVLKLFGDEKIVHSLSGDENIVPSLFGDVCSLLTWNREKHH